MAPKAFSIQPFEAKRVRVESTRSYDEVLLNLRKEVGTATLQEGNKQGTGRVTRKPGETLGEAYRAAMHQLGGITRQHFEQAVQSRWERAASCSSTR